MGKTEEKIFRLAANCIEAEQSERPENGWLCRVYERFRRTQGGLSKTEADERLYLAMYGVPPEKSSDTLKIRYWRTGRHLPSNREQCESLGRALELSSEEERFLMQAWFDRSDKSFAPGREDPVWLDRRKRLDELIGEYLDKIHPAIRFQLYHEGMELEKNLRHIYYMDARRYMMLRNPEETGVERHIVSINYESEFSRQMKLLGEIPRRTMIRHLLIFSVPYINRELLSQRLSAFGYLPLSVRHTQADGSRLDRLILGFLELYEKECSGKDPWDCSRWFRENYGLLDRYLEKQGKTSLRFLYFKALKDKEKWDN